MKLHIKSFISRANLKATRLLQTEKQVLFSNDLDS